MTTSTGRVAARAIAVLTALASMLAPAVVAVSPAAGASTTPPGNDFSWPQCQKGVGNGQGQPLPSGTRRFEIVGLTNGVGFHENPCLANEWRYARGHASYVTAYTMLTYPTSAQRKSSATGHYGTCTTLACRLRNNGWAQGLYADASMRRIGARPPMVWVDVEPRPQQPWSSSTSNNSLVVKAAISSLQHRGYRVGVYSNLNLWHQVAGYSTKLPEWVPAGGLTYGCTTPFSAGHVWLSQWAHYYSSGDGYDENGICVAMPKLSTVLQPAHPTVTTSRDRTTHKAYAHYSDGRRFALGATVVQRPAVVRVVSEADGVVPLFVAVNTAHHLIARTLGSGWHSLGNGYCAATPGVGMHGATVWVGCRAEGRVLSLTKVGLDADGVPSAASTTAYDGSLAGSPSVRLSSGTPVVTADFTDGSVQTRTPTAPWSRAADGTTVSVPMSTRL